MTQRERDTIIHLIAGGWDILLELCLSEFFFLDCWRIWFDYVKTDRINSFYKRFAGTVGAIVTCPLEVVKTRLQSSSSRFYPSPILDAAKNSPTIGTQFNGTNNKRDICTSILRKRSQVSQVSLFLYEVFHVELLSIKKMISVSFHRF